MVKLNPRNVTKKKSGRPANRSATQQAEQALEDSMPRAPALRRQSRVTVNPYADLDMLTSEVCGLLDPFCPHANGAKYPDASSVRTLAFQIHQEAIMTTGPAGASGIVIVPTIEKNSIVGSNVTGSVMATTVMTAPVVPKLTGASKYRIVSAGFRLSSIAAPLTASGMVHIRSFQVEDGDSLNPMDGTTYTASKSVNVPLNRLADQIIVFQRTSQRREEFYVPGDTNPTNSINDWVAPGFCPVSVLLTGGPADAGSIHVEVIYNIEYLFEEGAALQLAATPAPRSHPVVTEAASFVSSLGSQVFADSTDALARGIRVAASTALRTALGPVYGTGAAALLK